MTNDVECAPGVFAFILVGPGFRQIAEKRIESGGSSGEKGDGVRQVVFHGAPRFAHGGFPGIVVVSVLGRKCHRAAVVALGRMATKKWPLRRSRASPRRNANRTEIPRFARNDGIIGAGSTEL